MLWVVVRGGGSISSSLDGGVDRTYRNVAIPYQGDWDQSVLQHEMAHAYGMPHSFADWNPYGNPWDVVSRTNMPCNRNRPAVWLHRPACDDL